MIAKSIERIHAANLVNFGIVPFSFAQESDWESLPEKTEVRIPGIRKALETGKENIMALAGNKQISPEYEPLQKAKRHTAGRGTITLHSAEQAKEQKIENRSAALAELFFFLSFLSFIELLLLVKEGHDILR